MRLLITGGTGFIGATLCQLLVQHGHEPVVLTRLPQAQPPQAGVQFLSWQADEWRRAMNEVGGVVNLAGESIAAKRWSPRQKHLIQESRVETTRFVIEAIATASRKPAVLISASAIGYYGARGDEEIVETDPPGRGFLAETCQAWEEAARQAERFGVRVVRLRIGLVLGQGGGALAKMAPPFRAYVGGPLGSGRQWVSWIHRDDVIGLVAWALTRPDVSGAVNATAPNPVTMAALCRGLGQTLGRPSWAPVPAVVLRLALGEMAQMLLTGQRVIPRIALEAGYVFRFPWLNAALEACLKPVKGEGSRMKTMISTAPCEASARTE